jgi:hypothetical protein
VGKRRHGSKVIVEHAASSRRVIDALVRRLPAGTGTGASGKLTSTLCPYPRNVTVNRCRAGEAAPPTPICAVAS